MLLYYVITYKLETDCANVNTIFDVIYSKSYKLKYILNKC